MKDKSLEVFYVDTFSLLVLVGLERTEVKSRLILVVVTPLRTHDVMFREERLVLLCTKIDKFWLECWYQNY